LAFFLVWLEPTFEWRKLADEVLLQLLDGKRCAAPTWPDLEDEIANRSIAEIVTDICRDLGIAALPGTHPWKRRIPHDIAILNARAAQLYNQAPSAELAVLLAAAPPPPPRRITPLWGVDPSMDPAAQVAHILHAVSRNHQQSGG
jgi:hypothetical protein